MNIKLAKAIANSGYCSRREAEKLILNEQVYVNKKLEANVACRVEEEDIITINGQDLNTKPEPVLYAFHKPIGCITSKSDELERPTIYDFLPEELQSLMPVGRLDFNTEGLLLLTNNGELKRYFELPNNALERSYKIRAFGKLKHKKLERMSQGVEIEGINYRPFTYNVEKTGNNNWITMQIKEGKNREVRRLMLHLGLEVNRLIRMQYGAYKLGKLAVEKTQQLDINLAGNWSCV